jgi:magnesium chelatase accessory protein
MYEDRVSVARLPMALDWGADGRHWPHRRSSRFVDAAGLRWHVQVMGRGPVALLLHGAGASTHSWRDLMPKLARHFTVVAPDLPGHAFTERPRAAALSLPDVARGVRRLLDAIGLEPQVAVGHSAGAAILARMCLDRTLALQALVCINGALLPFRGVQGLLFSPIAKLLSRGPWVPHLVAWRATDRAAVQRLIDGTGSRLDADGVDYYARLVRDPSHIAGVLQMMAHWDLAPLAQQLSSLDVPVALVVGSNDGTVRPDEAAVLLRRLPCAELHSLPARGHLVHEEAPAEVARLVMAFMRRHMHG